MSNRFDPWSEDASDPRCWRCSSVLRASEIRFGECYDGCAPTPRKPAEQIRAEVAAMVARFRESPKGRLIYAEADAAMERMKADKPGWADRVRRHRDRDPQDYWAPREDDK